MHASRQAKLAPHANLLNHSLSTWETQLRDVLGLRKKFKKKDWVLIHQHVAQRREQGKESDILLNNTKIEWKRAWKEMRRSGKLSTQVRQGK